MLRNYSSRTAEAYVRAVYCLAQHYGRSPDTLRDEELRAYLLHLHLNTGKAASMLNVTVSGLRFFYHHVLHGQFYHLERNLLCDRRTDGFGILPLSFTQAQ